MNAPRDASFLLSEWASGVSKSDISDRARAVVNSCLIDTIGVAIAGAQTPVGGLARRATLQNGVDGWSEVLGSKRKISPAAAAFCNATAAHALDFDDNCYSGFVHGSAIIVPAALAQAQDLDATGADLITAITIGAECEYAVGAGAGIALYEKGWWTTGLLGPIGAGIAAGRLLKLDARQMQSCIGFTVAAAGGTKACFGTDAKALMAGQASEAGLKWANLAFHGASGPTDAFSTSAGFMHLHNDGVFNNEEIAKLGQEWHLVKPGIDVKNYPVCLSSHAAIDLVADIVKKERISHGDVEAIVCDVPPVVIANLKYTSPKTPREAQFSMVFPLASIVCFGALGLDQLQDQVLHDDAIQAVMRRVRMVSGPMWDEARRKAAPEGASVSISLKDGRQFSGFCAHALGTAANPMSMKEAEEKFLRCVQPAWGAVAAQDLLQSLKRLDADVPVRGLLKASL